MSDVPFAVGAVRTGERRALPVRSAGLRQGSSVRFPPPGAAGAVEGRGSAAAEAAVAAVAAAEIAVGCLLAAVVAAIAQGVHVDQLRSPSISANVERVNVYGLWDRVDELGRVGGDWGALRAEASRARARAQAVEARVPRPDRAPEPSRSDEIIRLRVSRSRGDHG